LYAAHNHPLEPPFRQAVLDLSQAEGSVDPRHLAELDVQAGRLFAEAALALLQKTAIPPQRISAIGCHGQTLYHRPDGKIPYTWQIGDPNTIAWRTGITTVADFRRKDIAAGGQGAPLVPTFHAAILRDPAENRLILNLGGIANLTVLPADPAQPVRGFDTGPANCLLDAWATRHLGQPLDRDGAWAAGGQVDPGLLGRLLADPYFRRPPPKSTGRDYFNLDWLAASLVPQLSPATVQATLLELTAASVAQAARAELAAGRLLVCGGGVHNRALMARLAAHLPCPVESTATHGLNPDWVEAMCFAWLARQTLAGLPGNLPEVTGAQQALVLGGVYPAD
jgi:anhydro-N-acetylmuramic acid kinase